MDLASRHLQALLEELSAKLAGVPPGDLEQQAALIGRKSEVELAISRLALCERWALYPSSIIRRLPRQKCQSGSSDYRIMEDCETEHRESWVEADFDGQRHRLNEGDLIVRP